MSHPAIERIERKALQYVDEVPTADAMLRTAVMETMQWAPALAASGRLPSLKQLEKLASQLAAILIASEKNNGD